MHGRRLLSWIPVVAAGLVLVILSGCGGGSDEEQIIQRYFDASRLRDNRTLANIALVGFPPDEQGTVQDFSVVSMGEEITAPIRIKELTAAYEEAQSEQDEVSARMEAYQEENLEAVRRVMEAERDGTEVGRADLEVQEAWGKISEEMSAASKKAADAERAVSGEAGVVELSTYDDRNPIIVADYDGDLISKEITIDASVRTPDGQDVEKQLTVNLLRAELHGEAGEVSGRWIITSVWEAGP
jgi:hypothetical protein